MREVRLDCFLEPELRISSTEEAGVRERERRPPRGLGVGEGEGRHGTTEEMVSGVRERGRKLRFEGRGFAGVALVMARDGVIGVIGVLGGGKFSLLALAEGNSTVSSSSSSSSKSVPSWSLLDEDGPRSLKESRLLVVSEFA